MTGVIREIWGLPVRVWGLGFRVEGFSRSLDAVDDRNPAFPIVRSIPYFPWFRVLKVMQS